MHRNAARPALAAGFVLLALLVAGCGSSSSGGSSSATTTPSTTTAAATTAAPATGPVKVDLTEWKIAPAAATATAGKVTFDVHNSGAATHEMVVIRTDKGAANLGTGARVPETGSVGETGDVAAGKSKSVTLKLKPGHYALICNIAGHYSSGMHTDFTVN